MECPICGSTDAEILNSKQKHLRKDNGRIFIKM